MTRKQKKIKRKHRTDKRSHAKRRHARTKKHSHKRRMLQESKNMSALLTQLLKMSASTDADPYHYDKRHYSKDPEYKWSDARTQKFKRGFPAPDVNFLRSQGPAYSPYKNNFARQTIDDE